MQASLAPLLPLFERERRAGRALALGVLVHTAGSTYQKPGALILIAADGEYAGLLSGGCLEADLREHAFTVIRTGEARAVRYDLHGPDELLWGLGLGCEGAMAILLIRVGPQNDWQPLSYFAQALEDHLPAAVGIVCESSQAEVPLGALVLPPGTNVSACAAIATPAMQALLAGVRAGHRTEGVYVEGAVSLFLLPLALPPRILLLGAGPDAIPVVDLAARLSWEVTLVDHRPAYANPAHFPAADAVLLAQPETLGATLDLRSFIAAVVMSHHLLSDRGYLRTLAASAIPYIGLLGPASRRDKLLSDLGSAASRLRARLHAPVGLPLGGRTPASIALAIIAELHAFIHAPDAHLRGGPLSVARAAGAE